MSTKQQFMSSLLSGTGFKFQDGKGYLSVSNNMIATCQLNGDSNYFNGISVDFSSLVGTYKETFTFPFSDLEKDPTNPHPAAHREDLHVNSSCGWEWYIATPTQRSVDNFNKEVNELVDYFKVATN